MRLRSLLNCANVPDVEVSGMTCDSRQVRPNDIFVAYAGSVYDGHDFVDDAIQRGAKCVISQRPVQAALGVVRVCDAKLVKDRNNLAAKLHGHPSKQLRCFGVTGTNGKTSVAYGLASVFKKTAFAGSLGWGGVSNLKPSNLTTADGVTLQSRLSELTQHGFSGVAMEVSSHALSQNRIAHLDLNVGIYTNLSRDHLDYHGSMGEYAAAKRKLFECFKLDYAVINIDDWFGRELVWVCRSRGIPNTTYGSSAKADVSYELTRTMLSGSQGNWKTEWGTVPFSLPVNSEFGVRNCAAVFAVAIQETGDLNLTSERVNSIAVPPGRMEFISTSSSSKAVIDYAHTPDALRAALTAVRKLQPSKVVCVFGCGGDRDAGKRPLMGSTVDELADSVVITNDNPRSENPQDIADDVLTGFSDKAKVRVILDRQEAIATAINDAPRDAIVLVAGKGHEDYQEIQGDKQAFSDRDVIRQLSGGR